MGIILAILILGVIIFIHELGHFLLAKANRICVEEFSIGMGPRLISTVKGETRYSLKLVPFGGSCMMLGEDEEASGEGSFNSKSVPARISVIVAGPLFNFVLAFIGAIIMISIVGTDPATVLSVEDGSPAAQAGLRKGDQIIKLCGRHVDVGREINFIESIKGIPEQVEMTVIRDGEKEILIFPSMSEDRYMLGFTYYSKPDEPAEISYITPNGVMDQANFKVGDIILSINGAQIKSGEGMREYLEEHPMDDTELMITYERDGMEYDVTLIPEIATYKEWGFSYNLYREKVSPLQTLKYSFIEVKFWVRTIFDSLSMLFTGKAGIKDMSGPVGVVQVIDDTYQETHTEGAVILWCSMLNWLIMISANLGIVNLLPFPALDGGRLVFLIIEGIRRKPLNRNIEGMVNMAGMILLMVFMVFVLFNDIGRLF